LFKGFCASKTTSKKIKLHWSGAVGIHLCSGNVLGIGKTTTQAKLFFGIVNHAFLRQRRTNNPAVNTGLKALLFAEF
jgi:hypothetical protein